MRLESPVSTSFRCQRAADSLDIDTAEKSVHELTVEADVETPFSVGLVVGASGSGKTTLARSIWGDEWGAPLLDPSRPVIEQFPDDWTYDQCAAALSGMGLTSVPCWIRPAHTLSNGQRARAEAALLLARPADGKPAVIDEWTSVVDRTVAKAMSHCIQKYARRSGASVVLLSCHYDVIEWLNPDWIIDCNRSEYTDRRSLWRDYQRTERLTFTVREVDKSTWGAFSRYHYLSAKLPPGLLFCYGMFHGADQIGFTCYANYVPPAKGKKLIMHGSRTVIHPDYVGLGLGLEMASRSAEHMINREGGTRYRVMGKFSSVPLWRAVSRDPRWIVRGVRRPIGKARGFGSIERGRASVRRNVKIFLVEYMGEAHAARVAARRERAIGA